MRNKDGAFHYIFGMQSAALTLIPAAYGFYVTMREIKNSR